MKPNINFHRIASIRLGDVRWFEKDGDCPAFAVRSITVFDQDGDRFEIKLFAERADALAISGDAKCSKAEKSAEVSP